MRIRLTLPTQWFLTLLIGLALGFVFQPVTGSVPAVTGTPIMTATGPGSPATPSPAPFVTLPGGWLAPVAFSRQAAPQMVKVIHLDQARLTAFPSGENRIQILNAAGRVLYSQSFRVDFLVGDPAQVVDEKTMIFVLHALEGASQVVVQTPNGKVSYDLPGQ